MATPNAQNVSFGKPSAAGGVWSGPLTATTPKNATTALKGFTALGYVSEDGLTNTVETDTESITAWGGDTVLTARTSRTETFTWSFIENTPEVLKEVYGQDNVTEVSSGFAVIHNSAELPERQYVFEIALTGGRVKRIVVPNGKITEIGDVVYADGEPIAYEVTLTCAADQAGATVYEYVAATGSTSTTKTTS